MKFNLKIGDKQKLSCGCVLIKGQPVRDEKHKDGSPVHEVIRTTCPRCRAYQEKLDAYIPRAINKAKTEAGRKYKPGSPAHIAAKNRIFIQLMNEYRATL